MVSSLLAFALPAPERGSAAAPSDSNQGGSDRYMLGRVELTDPGLSTRELGLPQPSNLLVAAGHGGTLTPSGRVASVLHATPEPP